MLTMMKEAGDWVAFYFISFVVIGQFCLFNLVLGAVLESKLSPSLWSSSHMHPS